MTWRVNGSAVNLNNDRISNENNSLTFSPVTTSDSGTYVCTLTLTSLNLYLGFQPEKSSGKFMTVKRRSFIVIAIAMKNSHIRQRD